LDPIENQRALFVGGLDLKGRTVAGVDTNERIAPPAGFNDFHIQDGFENEKRWEIAARDLALGKSRLSAGVALERAPELTLAVDGTGRTQDENTLCPVLLKGFEIIGGDFVIEAGERTAGDEDGAG